MPVRREGVDAATASETALAQLVTELGDAQRLAHVGSFRVDVAAGTIAYWSDELFRILGLDPSTFEPTLGALVERVHPDDRKAVEAIIGSSFRNGTPFEVEARVIRPDGEIRVLATSARVTMDERNQPAQISGVCQDVTSRKAAEAALTHQAAHDGLTGLPNRALLLDRLAMALARGARTRAATAVFFVDIDRFKWLNDRFGHAGGDHLLTLVAQQLANGVRPGDTVARLGGDEFVVVCENLSGDGIVRMARRLMRRVARPTLIDGDHVTPSVSIGIAVSSPGGDDTPGSLLRDADAAMYKAKERGRSNFEIFDAEMRAAAHARAETERALRRAVDGDEIVSYFQPIVDLATGRPVAVEALARWIHPSRGLLLPDDFVPIAEESGLVVPIGAAVLRGACNAVADWRRAYPELAGLELSVNLSARQLVHPTVVDTVRDALHVSGLQPDALCLEITESVLLDDAELAAAVLDTLKGIGVRIGLDDFGTGFSSLTHLKGYPVDVLKIDRSFVAGLGASRDDRAIVSGVIDIAHGLAMTTVGEGVETHAQALELERLGCALGQGYLWSGPVPGPDAVAFMRRALAGSAAHAV